MHRIALTAAAATLALSLQPAAACETVAQATLATPLTTAALQIAPAAAAPNSELPAIASLTEKSDFTVFMEPGVPSSVRAAALRKLWRTNPIFSRSDGLDSDFLDHR